MVAGIRKTLGQLLEVIFDAAGFGELDEQLANGIRNLRTHRIQAPHLSTERADF